MLLFEKRMSRVRGERESELSFGYALFDREDDETIALATNAEVLADVLRVAFSTVGELCKPIEELSEEARRVSQFRTARIDRRVFTVTF